MLYAAVHFMNDTGVFNYYLVKNNYPQTKFTLYIKGYFKHIPNTHKPYSWKYIYMFKALQPGWLWTT